MQLMKIKVLVGALFIVQSLFDFNLINSCSGKDDGLQKVNAKLTVADSNDEGKLFLVTTKPNDNSSLICEAFSSVVKGDFYILSIDDEGYQGISDLIVFEQKETDFDGKVRISYDAFLMDTFTDKQSLHNDCMNCVEFARLKLFVEDEKDSKNFILVPDCIEVFKALFNNNKNRLFKNIPIKLGVAGNHIQKCIADKLSGCRHEHTDGKHNKEIVISFPKSVTKK